MSIIICKAPKILLYPNGEHYSATIGDYWNLPDNYVFSDDEDMCADLVQTEYNELGNLGIKRIIKRGPITMKDLRRLGDK